MAREILSQEKAREALEQIKTKKPDVIVSDIGMPGEDGYTLIKKIRGISDETSKIPAVALTGFARSQDRARALISGFQNHVSKPVEIEELVTVIAGITGRLNF